MSDRIDDIRAEWGNPVRPPFPPADVEYLLQVAEAARPMLLVGYEGKMIKRLWFNLKAALEDKT